MMIKIYPQTQQWDIFSSRINELISLNLQLQSKQDTDNEINDIIKAIQVAAWQLLMSTDQ